MVCIESSKYGFRPGMIYRYNYRTDMSTFAIGAPTQESRIQFTAAVELTAVTVCELQLEVTNETWHLLLHGTRP